MKKMGEGSYSPTASATELITFPAAPPTPFATSVICEQLAKNKTEIRTIFFIY